MAEWKPGDRVKIRLPDGRQSHGWYAGTIREVDPPGLRKGVLVDLDEYVRGSKECFAAHAELERIA